MFSGGTARKRSPLPDAPLRPACGCGALRARAAARAPLRAVPLLWALPTQRPPPSRPPRSVPRRCAARSAVAPPLPPPPQLRAARALREAPLALTKGPVRRPRGLWARLAVSAAWWTSRWSALSAPRYARGGSRTASARAPTLERGLTLTLTCPGATQARGRRLRPRLLPAMHPRVGQAVRLERCLLCVSDEVPSSALTLGCAGRPVRRRARCAACRCRRCPSPRARPRGWTPRRSCARAACMSSLRRRARTPPSARTSPPLRLRPSRRCKAAASSPAPAPQQRCAPQTSCRLASTRLPSLTLRRCCRRSRLRRRALRGPTVRHSTARCAPRARQRRATLTATRWWSTCEPSTRPTAGRRCARCAPPCRGASACMLRVRCAALTALSTTGVIRRTCRATGLRMWSCATASSMAHSPPTKRTTTQSCAACLRSRRALLRQRQQAGRQRAEPQQRRLQMSQTCMAAGNE